MTDHSGSIPAPEFSRFVSAEAVRRADLTETIEATESERRKLAERLELESIGSLTATIRLRAVRGGQMIRVSGKLVADVVQTCVVSLDPVPAHVEESFEALFAPEALIEDPGEEIEIDPYESDEDSPEPMSNNRIDIGELTAQHLSLGLDPYPRADSAAFEGYDEGGEEVGAAAEPEEPEKPNPFAVLERLKTRQ
ncbi:YceD family protein [Azospirillum doebereinerae]